MRRFQILLLTLYLSLFNFMLISIFIGDNGVLAYRELEAYKERLYSNLSELEEINKGLNKNCKSLENAEQMMLIARDLGMIAKNERVLILENHQENSNYDLGSRYSSNIKDRNRIFNMNNIRFISFFLAVIMVTFIAVAKKDIKDTNGNKKRKPGDIENCIPDIAR